MESLEGLKVLYESVKSKVDYVANADNTLDAKAGTLLGIEITLAIGFVSLVWDQLKGIKYYEGIAGLIALTASIVLLLFVNLPKKYLTIVPNLFEKKEYLNKREDDLVRQLISNAQETFTLNNKILFNKVACYKSAIYFLLVAGLLLVISKLGNIYGW